MHISIHVNGYYDMHPIPTDVVVTEADLASGRVRPAAEGGHKMRVPVKSEQDVNIVMSEADIIGTIIHAYTEHQKCGAVLTRAEAVARMLQMHIIPNHTHPKWMEQFTIHDDAGPDEALFNAMIAPHLEADHGRAPGKNIDAEDVSALLDAYMEDLDEAGHVAHMHKHFKIKPKAKLAAVAAEGSK